MRFHPAELAEQPAVRHDEVLYAVRGGPYVKIGYTNDLERRMGELQVGCPYELEVLLAIPGSAEDEKIAHRKFQTLRTRGEWFYAAKPLLDWIEAARQTRSVR